jgi:hypothetical protein
VAVGDRRERIGAEDRECEALGEEGLLEAIAAKRLAEEDPRE